MRVFLHCVLIIRLRREVGDNMIWKQRRHCVKSVFRPRKRSCSILWLQFTELESYGPRLVCVGIVPVSRV